MRPEAVLLKTERAKTRTEFADRTRSVAVSEDPTFEVELERVTDSETGEGYYELEYELTWSVEERRELEARRAVR